MWIWKSFGFGSAMAPAKHIIAAGLGSAIILGKNIITDSTIAEKNIFHIIIINYEYLDILWGPAYRELVINFPFPGK